MRWSAVVCLSVAAASGCLSRGEAPPPAGGAPVAAAVAEGPAVGGAVGEAAALAPGPIAAPVDAAAPPPADAGSVPPSAPGEATPGIHGAPITQIAATEDGTAAVTADSTGAIRLWPTLDGRREPVVVAAPRPAALAIARERDELVIADLDPIGGLAVVRTTATGAPLAHATVASERPYVLVRALAHGLLALRDDQRIDVLGLDGTRLGELAAEPGERIATIAVRRERALAIVVSARAVRGRWIDLGATAWGARTAALALDPAAPIVLAPDHRRVAGLGATSHAATLVALATGRVTVRATDEGEGRAAAALASPRGFLDDHALVLAAPDGQLGVWRDDDPARVPAPGDDSLDEAVAAIAIADHEVIAGTQAQLTLARAGEPVRYLGYRVPSATALRRLGGRWYVGAPGASAAWTELDDELVQRRVIAPPPTGAPYLTSVLLDSTHGLAIAGTAGGATQLVRFTVGSPEVEVVLDGDGTRIEYDEDSHLVAYDTSIGWYVFRVEPRRARLGPPVLTDVTNDLYLVDPARAHGRIGVEIDRELGGEAATVTPILGLCESCDGHVRRGRPQHVRLDSGDWRLIDDAHDLTHVADLEPRARRSPEGALVASYGGDRVTLRDAAGAARWTIALPGVSAVAWSETGELVALANGLVRLDVATGAFAERRCGWLFGLATEPASATAGPVVCDAPG